ncbi:hypothetical protein [Nakamurella sp. UYEF19]|uniref:hypothetical protein n=1 Tax=Nakamurella sp. UYEF19 TaxID=1756392 RepID=UPI00339249F1
MSTRTTTITPTVAMRAREVAAPTAADLAQAAEELVIVRRHYVPPAPLAAGKKEPGGSPKAPDQRGRAENRRGGRRPQRGAGE